VRALPRPGGSSELVEIETGKGADALERRPQLAAALDMARKLKCPVVVAKFDRLSRDVHFISGLMSRKVPFVVAEHRGLPLPPAHLRCACRARAPHDLGQNQNRDDCRES
jgi:hypothetical protein